LLIPEPVWREWKINGVLPAILHEIHHRPC
jgi:hypothetical protein